MSEWLELELADRLAPVRAPERLWYLVQSREPVAGIRATRRRPTKAVLLLAVAAAASLWVATAWRPEARNVRMVGLTATTAGSPVACRSCHTD